MKHAFLGFLASLLLVMSCRKEDDEPVSPAPANIECALDHLVSGYTCAPQTQVDVYLLRGHNDLPQMACAGSDVWVHVSGTPTAVNGVVQWSQGCYTLQINGITVATYTSTVPKEFHYVVD